MDCPQGIVLIIFRRFVANELQILDFVEKQANDSTNQPVLFGNLFLLQLIGIIAKGIGLHTSL